ncbi:hypothetical protein [Streptomyces adelaidensis]|uniref:hypothetical protein n=1 Tax=Streptomyces adelaidensis TaxID=2796465 RepID=UPI0019043C73|nr:hypothetical protein [Streptomyces adelaidensis]
MNGTTRMVKVNVALAALLLLFVSVLALRAQTGPDPGRKPDMTWEYDKVVQGEGEGDTELSGVMAVAVDDVWVVGQSTPNVGNAGDESAGDGFLLHYDGTGWQRRPMPESFGKSVYNARFDAVDSGGFLLTASLDLNSLRMANWDGTRWTALPKLPGDPRADDVRAFAADDIWVVDGQTRTYHWDGTRWTAMDLPVTVTALDGVAPDDLWAVGHHEPYDDDDPALPFTQPAAMHWDGGGWKPVSMPEYRFEVWPTEPHAGVNAIAVTAQDDVRAYGYLASYNEDDDPDPPDEDIRLHWNGTRWTKLPNARGACADRGHAVRDGERGAVLGAGRYLTADGDCEKIAHSKLPSTDGIKAGAKQSLQLNAITAVPGTDKVIGVGSVGVSQGRDSTYRAVIAGLRR